MRGGDSRLPVFTPPRPLCLLSPHPPPGLLVTSGSRRRRPRAPAPRGSRQTQRGRCVTEAWGPGEGRRGRVTAPPCSRVFSPMYMYVVHVCVCLGYLVIGKALRRKGSLGITTSYYRRPVCGGRGSRVILDTMDLTSVERKKCPPYGSFPTHVAVVPLALG